MQRLKRSKDDFFDEVNMAITSNVWFQEKHGNPSCHPHIQFSAQGMRHWSSYYLIGRFLSLIALLTQSVHLLIVRSHATFHAKHALPIYYGIHVINTLLIKPKCPHVQKLQTIVGEAMQSRQSLKWTESEVLPTLKGGLCTTSTDVIRGDRTLKFEVCVFCHFWTTLEIPSSLCHTNLPTL